MKTTNKTNSKKSTVVNNTTKLLSNEKLGEKLFNEKVSFEESVKQFLHYYKVKQNITDKNFVTLRTKIYLRIAEKRSLKTTNVVCMLEQ